MPLAEEAGLMQDIDRWVLAEACAQIRDWTGPELPRMAVNLSGATLRHRGAFEYIARTARDHGVDPGRLELEVTESVTMEQGEAGAGTVGRLRQAGFHITVDDFGTGFSVLARLRQFPVDKLKIDKSFVQEVGVGAADAPLLRAIVAMAEGLGLVVVAEGVETPEQAELVKRLGCDLAQGYLFGLPAPVPALEVRGRFLAGLPIP
ncbi:MAG TPA: EAL domain-containing protein [Acidimicrobiales bacterium]|nr:EAL domain-containing protein [Acidimicrobiales bacterium]